MKFKLYLIFIIFFLLIKISVAIQNPNGWWNISGDFSCNVGCNLTNEFNSTSANLTYQAGVFNILTSDINFSGGMMTSSTANGRLLINNSILRGNDGSSTNNRIYIKRNLNITIQNSLFSNFGSFEFEGTTATQNYFIKIRNSTFRDSGRTQSNTWDLLNITNSFFYNITTIGQAAIRYRSRINGFYFTNNLIENVSGLGIEIFLGADKSLIENNTIINTGSHGIDNTNSNYTRILNNTIRNTGGYGIDFHSQGSHALVVDNVVINSTNGIIFSMGDGTAGNSQNLTFRNNRIYNLTTDAQGIVFNNVIDGYSFNDFVDGGNIGTDRGLGISSNSSRIYVYNVTLKNILGTSIHIHVNSSNIIIDNATVFGANETFNFRESNNITIRNSLLNGNEDYSGTIRSAPNSTNYTFENVLSYNFSWDTATDMIFNISNQRIFFKSLSQVNLIQYKNLNRALLLFSNNSVICSDLNSCNGNFNITLSPNNISFVLNKFNISEGNDRKNSPTWFPSSSNIYKTIASNLTGNITNVQIEISILSCSSLSNISYRSHFGSFTNFYNSTDITCNGNRANFTVSGIEPASGSNELNISYSVFPQWYLFVNQSTLPGTYTYYGCASDIGNDENCTDLRTVTVNAANSLFRTLLNTLNLNHATVRSFLGFRSLFTGFRIFETIGRGGAFFVTNLFDAITLKHSMIRLESAFARLFIKTNLIALDTNIFKPFRRIAVTLTLNQATFKIFGTLRNFNDIFHINSLEDEKVSLLRKSDTTIHINDLGSRSKFNLQTIYALTTIKTMVSRTVISLQNIYFLDIFAKISIQQNTLRIYKALRPVNVNVDATDSILQKGQDFKRTVNQNVFLDNFCISEICGFQRIKTAITLTSNKGSTFIKCDSTSEDFTLFCRLFSHQPFSITDASSRTALMFRPSFDSIRIINNGRANKKYTKSIFDLINFITSAIKEFFEGIAPHRSDVAKIFPNTKDVPYVQMNQTLRFG